MNKKFCQTHHLFYTNVECPYCFKERIHKIETKLVKPIVAPKKDNDAVTEYMVNELKKKFNEK